MEAAVHRGGNRIRLRGSRCEDRISLRAIRLHADARDFAAGRTAGHRVRLDGAVRVRASGRGPPFGGGSAYRNRSTDRSGGFGRAADQFRRMVSGQPADICLAAEAGDKKLVTASLGVTILLVFAILAMERWRSE